MTRDKLTEQEYLDAMVKLGDQPDPPETVYVVDRSRLDPDAFVEAPADARVVYADPKPDEFWELANAIDDMAIVLAKQSFAPMSREGIKITVEFARAASWYAAQTRLIRMLNQLSPVDDGATVRPTPGREHIFTWTIAGVTLELVCLERAPKPRTARPPKGFVWGDPFDCQGERVPEGVVERGGRVE